jgi:hypothetical protein
MTRVNNPILTVPILNSSSCSSLQEIMVCDLEEKSHAFKLFVAGLLNESLPIGSRNLSNTIDGGAGYSFIYNYLTNCIVQTYNLEELDIYGTSRAGTVIPDLQLYANTFTGTVNPDGKTDPIYILSPYTGPTIDASKTKRLLGNKSYELSNHLGNVLVTVSDRKISHSTGEVNIDYYTADVQTAQDYYAFGAPISDRTYNVSSNYYRYGFNKQEKDDELFEYGNSYTAEFWEYDVRLARRFNLDPVIKISESPYACIANSPIWLIDPSGADTDKLYYEGSAMSRLNQIQNPKQGDKYEVFAFLVAGNYGNYYAEQITRVYHAGNDYGPAGWYSESEYEFINRDWGHGQVLPSVTWWECQLSTSGRSWNGWEVNLKGYLTGLRTPQIGIIDVGLGKGSALLKEGEYAIYYALKFNRNAEKVLPYIGKAINGIEYRYSEAERLEIFAKVFKGLEKIPNNGIALCVEQHILELNGWEGKAGNIAKPIFSNINNATVQEIFKEEALKWLDGNVKNWKTLYKFKK